MVNQLQAIDFNLSVKGNLLKLIKLKGHPNFRNAREEDLSLIGIESITKTSYLRYIDIQKTPSYKKKEEILDHLFKVSLNVPNEKPVMETFWFRPISLSRYQLAKEITGTPDSPRPLSELLSEKNLTKKSNIPIQTGNYTKENQDKLFVDSVNATELSFHEFLSSYFNLHPDVFLFELHSEKLIYVHILQGAPIHGEYLYNGILTLYIDTSA